jgi:hypothetical protein
MAGSRDCEDVHERQQPRTDSGVSSERTFPGEAKKYVVITQELAGLTPVRGLLAGVY